MKTQTNWAKKCVLNMINKTRKQHFATVSFTLKSKWTNKFIQILTNETGKHNFC